MKIFSARIPALLYGKVEPPAMASPIYVRKPHRGKRVSRKDSLIGLILIVIRIELKVIIKDHSKQIKT
jgi:hypothetical protein